MIFENVELTSPNLTYGPDQGRIYSFDHNSNSLVIKTYPGGNLIQNAPLNSPLQNPVLSVEYDGFYFWTLSRLGQRGNLGILIQKWLYDGSSVQRQIGIGKEISLSNTTARIYDSESFTVRTITSQLAFSANRGDTSVTLQSADFLSPNDPIYFGPSNAESGEREENFVQSVVGNEVNLRHPLKHNYLVGDGVKYLKDIWVYNNANNLDRTGGSLLQISPTLGSIVGVRTGGEWRGVSAATVKSNGDLLFTRNLQLLTYRPFGSNSGFQSSCILLNEKPNRRDIVKVHDITADSLSVLKLQNEIVYFNEEAGDYSEEVWDSYNIDQEFFANRIFSITHLRNDKSLLFKENTTGVFTIKVRDQYDIPVTGRNLVVTEDDATGTIVPGYETVTTDLQGEAESRYRTGAGLEHSLPEITVTDVISNLNSKTNFVQIPSSSGEGVIEQRERFDSITYLSQQPVSGQTFISQPRRFESDIPLTQVEEHRSHFPLVQRTQENFNVITQMQNLLSESPVSQRQRIRDLSNVQQYDFLIFAIPEPYSIKNPVDTNIIIRVVGFGTLALLPNTLVFRVNGIDVTSQVQITPFPGGLEIFYNPSVDFPYLSIVTVEVFILDNDVPQNLVSTTYYFETVADFKVPLLVEKFPPNQSQGNSAITEVYAAVRDRETGIDKNSVEFYVNGKRVSPLLEENGEDLLIKYKPETPFVFQSIVSAAVKVSDKAGNTIVEPWSFGIGESAGILFIKEYPEECSALIPVDTPICVEAYGKEQGINISTMVFEVDNQKVAFALLPKVFRKE